MKIIIQYILVAVFAVGLGACSGVLDELPFDEVPVDKAIENIKDANTALNGVYQSTRDYTLRATVLGDIMTDEVFAAQRYSGYKDMQAYTYNANSGDATFIWTTLYQAINRANNILNVIEGLDGSASEKNVIKGQTLALRGYAYMELCKWFAKPYLVDSLAAGVSLVTSSNSNAKPQRASVAQVYGYIESDLLTANDLLKTKAGSSTEDIKYLNAWSTKGLLARYYLYKGQYQKAADFASQVITSNRFKMATASAKLAEVWKNDKNDDIAAEFMFMPAIVDAEVSSLALIGQNYYNMSQAAPRVSYVPAESFLALYTQFGPANASKFGTEDIRSQNKTYFIDTVTADGWKATLCFKYPGNSSYTARNANTPKVMKFSEMYLIRAEAYAELGQVDNALIDYNFIRKQRIVNYVNESSFSLINLEKEIANERLRELCFEGHYWYDLKRQGKGFERKPSADELVYIDLAASKLKVEPNNYHWLLPIPFGEITGNPTIQRNPGY